MLILAQAQVAQKSPVSKRVQCSLTERYIKTGLFWATCDISLSHAMRPGLKIRHVG